MGFKRKELAYVPLIESEEPATSTAPATQKVTLASLIATANATTKVSTPKNSGLAIAQTFATGSAATLLASHPGVREVLGPFLVQEYEEIKQAEDKFKRAVADRESKQPLLNWIKEVYEKETDATKKQEFVKEAITHHLVPPGTTTELLLKELGPSLTSLAPPETAQRLRDLKNAMITKYGYPN